MRTYATLALDRAGDVFVGWLDTETQTVFVSRYPSSASRPRSRPKPLALYPPNGAAAS